MLQVVITLKAKHPAHTFASLKAITMIRDRFVIIIHSLGKIEDYTSEQLRQIGFTKDHFVIIGAIGEESSQETDSPTFREEARYQFEKPVAEYCYE